MAANKHGDHDQHVREPPYRASQYLQPPIASEPAWNKGKHASQDAALAFQVSQAREVVDKARAKAASLPADPQREALLEEARWMVEELRVSLFAQTLGTSRKVSLQRITKLVSTI